MRPSVSTVASATLGTSTAVIIAWGVNTFAHVPITDEVKVAFGAILSALIGYFFNGGKAIDTAKPDETDSAGA